MEAFSIKDKSIPIYGIEKNTLISKEKGCLSYGFKVEYPALYTKEPSDYYSMRNVMESLFSVLEKNYIVHKQDFFLGGKYNPVPNENESDLQRFNRIHFTGRRVRKQFSYIYITKVPDNYFKYSSRDTNAFLLKERRSFLNLTIDQKYISKEEIRSFFKKKNQVQSLLKNKYFKAKELTAEDYIKPKKGILNLFKNFDFSGYNRDKTWSDNKLLIGDKQLKYYTLENADNITDYIPDFIESKEKQRDDLQIFKSNTSELGMELDKDHVFNQYFYLPGQEEVFKQLKQKQNRLYNFTAWLQPSGDNPRSEYKGESINSENNKIYARQVKEFKDDVVTNSQKVVFTHLNVGILEGDLETSENFNLKLKENISDLKDLYFASCPGNAIGIPVDLYMPLTESAAVSLAYFEDYSRGNAPFGGRYIDTNTGNVVYWDTFHAPFKQKLISNRNAWGVGKSGSGKSFTFNKMFEHEYHLGNHIFNIDGSSSFERSTKFFNGFFFKVAKGTKFGMNPFLLRGKTNDELVDKRTFISNFLLNLIDDPKTGLANDLTRTLFSEVTNGYYRDINDRYGFNSYFEYFKECAPGILKDNGMEDVIKLNSIQWLLKNYYKGGTYDYLLNSRDERLEDLVFNRYITFQIKELKDDPKLFTNVTFLLTNLYKEKLYHPDLLGKVKFCHYDESWTAMDKPILLKFMQDTIKTVRSQNGATIFTSQEIEDFFNSDIIKNTVLNNSEIGVISDISSYKGKKEYIKEILSLSNHQMNRLFALGNNLPDGYNMREIGIIYAKKHLVTLGNEVSLEEKSVYESNPEEKEKLKKLDSLNNNNPLITAIQYGGN